MPDTKIGPTATPNTSKRYLIDRKALADRCAQLGAFTAVEQAQLMGVDRATLRRWTTGSHTPSTETVEAVCERLGVTRDVLFPAMAAARPTRSIAEAAEEIAAGWPKLDEEQREQLQRIFAPILQAERAAPPQRTRRAAA